jgi:hypothetical protein
LGPLSWLALLVAVLAAAAATAVTAPCGRTVGPSWLALRRCVCYGGGGSRTRSQFCKKKKVSNVKKKEEKNVPSLETHLEALLLLPLLPPFWWWKLEWRWRRWLLLPLSRRRVVVHRGWRCDVAAVCYGGGGSHTRSRGGPSLRYVDVGCQ